MHTLRSVGHVLLAAALALWGLVLTASPATALTPTDDVVLVAAGSSAEVDVLANDDPEPGDWVDVVAGSDSRVTSWGSSTLYVDLWDSPRDLSESFSVDYQVHSGSTDEPIGAPATLTVHVLPDRSRGEGGDGAVTVRWPDLPADVDGARISWSEEWIWGHDDPAALGTQVFTGRPPWVVEGLTNGTPYEFYVTPRAGDVELGEGRQLSATPRAGNTAPVAVDDVVSLLEPGTVWFSPTDNDEDADFDNLSVISHTQPAVGSVSCDDWSCHYDTGDTVTSGFFDYVVADGYGGTDTGRVELVLREATLVGDEFEIPAEEEVVVDVRANDTGLFDTDYLYFDFSDPTVWIDEQSSGRTLVGAEAPGTYTGSYTAYTEDGNELGTAPITLTVGPPRDLVAYDDYTTTEMDVAVEVAVAQTDQITPDGFELAPTTITVQPEHGTASVSVEAMDYYGPDWSDDPVLRNLPVITYTPDPGYRGTDSLTYELTDAHGHSDTAVVEVEVTTRGVDPWAAEVGIDTADVVLDRSDSPAIDDVIVCYTVAGTRDGDAAPVTRPCDNTVPTTGVPSEVTLSGLTPDREYRVGVFTHYDDGSAEGLWVGPSEDGFTPGVSQVDEPWSEAGATQARLSWVNPPEHAWSNASTGTTIGWATDQAPTEPGTGAGWTSVGAGIAEADLAGLTPSTTYHYAIFATAADSWADPVTGTFTTRDANAAPVAEDDSATVNERGWVEIDVLANDTDPDGDGLSIRTYTQPSHGTVDCWGWDQRCDYSPDVDYTGPDSFTYTVSDGHFGTATATVHVTVVGIPEPPVAWDDEVTVTQGIEATIELSDLAHDPDDEALTYSVETPPANGTLECQAATGTCTFTAVTAGTDSFVYRVTDPTDRSDTGTITLDIVPNQPPSAGQGYATVAAGSEVAIDLRDLVSDPDGDALTFAVTGQPAKGSITCTAPGMCTYSANVGVDGTDSFVYTVTDAKGASATGSVLITLTRANNAPVATDLSLATANTSTLGVDLTAAVTDADGDPLTYALVAGPTPAGAGTVSCTAAGQCTYVPSTDFSGTMTFTYRANDGTDDSNVATVTVAVSQPNRAPVARADAATAVTGQAVQVDVAANDTDPDGDSLTFALEAGPANGTATCTALGVCTYTSAADFTGEDSFTYTVGDGELTATATVTITVTEAPAPPPPTPVITAQGGPTIKGKPKVGKVLRVLPGTVKPAGVKITYRWLRNGKVIKKATKARYKLTRKDRRKKISVRVVYTYPGAAKVTKVAKLRKRVR